MFAMFGEYILVRLRTLLSGGYPYCFECWYCTATDEERAIAHEAELEAEEHTEWLIEEWGRKRVEQRMCKFQTLAVMLLGFKRWSRRVVARVEAEYAADGPRGQQIIQEWSAMNSQAHPSGRT